MDNDVRIPDASHGHAANMTTAGARTNGTRAHHAARVAVKNEASPFQGSATPNGSKGESASRSRSPDDDVKPSPSDVSTPDTSSAAPRPNRKSSAKASRSATPSSRPNRTLFDQLPDATTEATSQFQVIANCLYGSKNMGSSDNDAFDCDCAEELRTSYCSYHPGAPWMLSISLCLARLLT